MKKSITILAIGVISFTNASASDFRSSELIKDINSLKITAVDYEGATNAKFISFADPSLISSELGNLKKSSKTLNQIITDDIKITDEVVSAKVNLTKKKEKKAQPVQLKKAFKN